MIITSVEMRVRETPFDVSICGHGNNLYYYNNIRFYYVTYLQLRQLKERTGFLVSRSLKLA